MFITAENVSKIEVVALADGKVTIRIEVKRTPYGSIQIILLDELYMRKVSAR